MKLENDNRSVIGKSTQTLFSENSKIFFPEISTLKRPIFTLIEYQEKEEDMSFVVKGK